MIRASDTNKHYDEDDDKGYPADPEWEAESVCNSDISSLNESAKPVNSYSDRQTRKQLSQISINSFNNNKNEFQQQQQRSFVLSASQTGLRSLNNKPDAINSPIEARTAWGRFTNHVKNITCDSLQFKMKPTSSKGSKAFKDILTEVQDELNKKRSRKRGLTKAINVNTAIQCLKENGEYDIDEVEYMDYDDNELNKSDQDTTEEDMNDQCNVSIVADEHSEVKEVKEVNTLPIIDTSNDSKVDKQNTAFSNSEDKEITRKLNVIEQETVRQTLYERYLYNPRPWYEGLVLYDKYKARLDLKRNPDRPESSPLHRNNKIKLPKRPHTNLSMASQKHFM